MTGMNNSRLEKKAYESLLETELIPRKELETAYQEAEAGGLSFSQIVVKKKLIHEGKLLEHYAKIFNLPFVDLKKASISSAVCDSVPLKFASYYHFFPYSKEGNRLTIAVARPVDVHFIDEVRFGLGMEIDTVFATEKDIDEMLQKKYGLGADTVDQMTKSASPSKESAPVMANEVQDIEKLAENASVIKLVNQIILEASRKGASDIHLEPFRGKIRLRYRVDGVLAEQQVPPEMKKFFSPMVSRIKIMANLNIIERRLPQDGKTRVKTQEQTIDLRVSSIPTPHGESIVIRLLPGNMIRTLEDLGMEPEHHAYFKELLKSPFGIIFVTGPTGSGKSTTLYAGLSSINKVEKKVITIEDPVEYELEGATQIQVAPELGLTFAHGLRSVLRHDPDVMMVGEVRDLETADIAIRIALTGHLILSTLHTNDAASGVTRLLDIGVEPYLVSSSVNAFIAQRLVRSICTHCKEEDKHVLPELKAMILHDLRLGSSEEIKIYKGAGCEQCHGSGYSGRSAIYEMLPVSEEIRKLIFERSSSEDIKKKAREQGMLTMRQCGWRKVLKGLTTPDEIIQVSAADSPAAVNVFSTLFSEKKKNQKTEEPPASPDESKEMDIWVDRRAFTRIKCVIPFLFRKLDIEAEDVDFDAPREMFDEAETIDLSANGISITGTQCTPGAAIDIRLSLPGDHEEIQCIGRVVRSIPKQEPVPSGSPGLYITAVTFLAITSADRNRLDRFCKNRSKAA